MQRLGPAPPRQKNPRQAGFFIETGWAGDSPPAARLRAERVVPACVVAVLATLKGGIASRKYGAGDGLARGWRQVVLRASAPPRSEQHEGGMLNYDEEIVQELLASDEEFKRLYQKHQV